MSDDHDDDVKRFEGEGGPSTEPDVNDPDLDDFTHAMTDGAEGGSEPELGKVGADHKVIRMVQANIAQMLQLIIQRNDSILHIEVLIALANAYLGVTENYLASIDLEVYEANRQEVLQVVGIMAAHINSMRPVEQQLAEAAVASTRH
jgi:hypothetical protein